jgi:hypothetical protein
LVEKRGMEEAPENGKELFLNSAHANGMNENTVGI